jgi:hypothetical protein
MGGPVEGLDAVGERTGKKIAPGHRNRAGEDEQDRRQLQVVLAGKHQPGGDIDVQEGKRAGQGIGTGQHPTESGNPVDPAHAIEQIARGHGDQRGD